MKWGKRTKIHKNSADAVWKGGGWRKGETINPRIPILAALDVLLLSFDDNEGYSIQIFVEKGPKLIWHKSAYLEGMEKSSAFHIKRRNTKIHT